MGALGPIETLILISGIAAAIGFAGGRVDEKNKRFRPIFRSLTVAAGLTLSLFALLILYFVLGARSVGITIIGSVIGSVLACFCMFVTSLIGYCIGHRGVKQTAVEGSYGGDGPVTRMEESGNPYQPPST